MISQRLKEVFEKAAKLPEEEQDQLAALIEEEMLDEERWQVGFEKSGPMLQEMAEKALEEYKAGKTEPLESLFEEPN
jgi:hypothetical protein